MIEEAKAEAAEIMKRQTDEASSRAESDLRAAGEQGERVKAEALDKVNAETEALRRTAASKENEAIRAVIDALGS